MNRIVIRVLSSVVACLPGFALAAATTLTEPCDFSTYDPAGATEFLIHVPTTVDEMFTLSTDLNWSDKFFRVDQGNRFWFDLQNHALNIGTLFRNEGKNDDILFKNGTITGANSSWLRMGYYGSTDTSGSKLVFDNVTYSAGGSSYYQGSVGANTIFALTNGASFSVNCVQFFFKGPKDVHTNNQFIISNGSKFYCPAISLCESSTTNTLQNNRIVVTGENSFLGARSTSYSDFGIGAACNGGGISGLSMEISDQASFYYGKLSIGAADGACSNVVTVSSGASIGLQQELVVGKGVGANYNRFELLNANHARKTATDSDCVGYYGCHNEYVISNSVAKPMYFCLCGVNPGGELQCVPRVRTAERTGRR